MIIYILKHLISLAISNKKVSFIQLKHLASAKYLCAAKQTKKQPKKTHVVGTYKHGRGLKSGIKVPQIVQMCNCH